MHCQATTLKNTPCKLYARSPSPYCNYHNKDTDSSSQAPPLQTFTLTFGDQAENNVGMVKIGTMADHGFDLDDFNSAKDYFTTRGIDTTIHDLSAAIKDTHPNVSPAYLLIAKKGLSSIVDSEAFYQEQLALPKDTLAKSRGKVVNKRARYNLCFDDTATVANYEEGQGTIIAYDTVPLMNTTRQALPLIFGPKATNLKCEGNYYYDVSKCGIGFHGDAERKLVIGVRVGASMPLRYRWFHDCKPISEPIDFMLEDGDMYAMSEKTVGTDWRESTALTLRHAAGCDKYLKWTEKR
ncbi:Hypothetical protein MVR_LOCUS8 [uncultured virus]|nr:Hypothetical protein MVR_LOCUS8 [uncultured virus]